MEKGERGMFSNRPKARAHVDTKNARHSGGAGLDGGRAVLIAQCIICTYIIHNMYNILCYSILCAFPDNRG